MPKIPLKSSMQNRDSRLNNKEKIDATQYNEASDPLINLSSMDEIEWVTNAIEPEQQRGPSENP